MFSSYPIIFAMILSVRPRSALIEKLVTIPKLFYPTRSASFSGSCCGGGAAPLAEHGVGVCACIVVPLVRVVRVPVIG